ncbi:MAG: hypothetical protein L0J39_12970, partial [Tetragenococcus koreensis]|nr:hypothetical protein [Tetragenococcus koreensis]
SLKHIFFQAYDYDKKLPDILLKNISSVDKKAFNKVTTETFIQNEAVQVHFDLNAKEEEFTIFRVVESVDEKKYYINIKTQIAGEKQKLKMLVNIIDQIMAAPLKLDTVNSEQTISYSHFLID